MNYLKINKDLKFHYVRTARLIIFLSMPISKKIEQLCVFFFAYFCGVKNSTVQLTHGADV